jgi:hypothetical protein
MMKETQRQKPESGTPSDEKSTSYKKIFPGKDVKDTDGSHDSLPPGQSDRGSLEQIPQRRKGKSQKQDSSIFFQQIEKNSTGVLRNNGEDEKLGYDTKHSIPQSDKASKTGINTKHHVLSENEQMKPVRIFKKDRSLLDSLHHSGRESESLAPKLQSSAPKQPVSFSVRNKGRKEPRLVIGRLRVEVIPPTPPVERQKIIRSTPPQKRSIQDLKTNSSLNKLRFGLGQM